MKTLAIFLGLAFQCAAAIAHVGSAANNANSTTVVITLTTSTGNTIACAAAIRTTTTVVASVTDTGGSTYTQALGANNGTNARMEVWWTAVNASVASTSITVTISPTGKFAASCGEYSGIVSLGTCASGTGSAANPTISKTTVDNDNWIFAGFSHQNTGTATAGTGNLRATSATSGGAGASNVGTAGNDNTSATPASVTNTVTWAAQTWVAVACEFRTVAPAVAGIGWYGKSGYF